MTTFTETRHSHEGIVSEANGQRSRDEGTVTVPTGGLPAMTILGKLTGGTKNYVPLALSGSDGSETVSAISIAPLEEGDQRAALFRRDCELAEEVLTYPDGATPAQKTTINTALEALGIILRDSGVAIT